MNFGTRNRILTGIRPTGPLHLGHFVGALKQWIPLQETFDCFFLIADIQAMTTHADKPALIQSSVREVALDWMSVGLDPRRANVHFVLQSQIAELNQLYTLLSMVTPLSWISQNPTVKSEMATLSEVTMGFYDYPVSQAADILLVSHDPARNTNRILVPVGKDQVPHLESTNDIARRFNTLYGKVFSLCEARVGEIGRLVGTDGQAKMSKSLGNCIYLNDPPEVVTTKVMRMYTDPKRLRATDPGTVEGNPVFMYHDAFNTNTAEVDDLKERYGKGTVGDVEVKKKLIVALENFLAPIRERRAAASKEKIFDILQSGTDAARKIGKQTVARAFAATKLDYADLKT